MILPPSGNRVEESRDDAVDAVERETALARKRHRVARSEAEGAGWSVALKAANAKERGVPQRNRNHRRGKLFLVAILVQAHPRGRVV